MPITRSVLVQIGSIRVSNERYWKRISDYICTSMNLLQFINLEQNLTFREAKSGSNTSSPKGAIWPTFHRWNRLIFRSYPWIPLDGWQNQGFFKIFEIFWTIGIYVKFHKKNVRIKKLHSSKTIMNFEILIVACTTIIKSSYKNALNFFSTFFPGSDFFTLFWFILRMLFSYIHRMTQPQIIFGWNSK